jgi:hypothetical protein
LTAVPELLLAFRGFRLLTFKRPASSNRRYLSILLVSVREHLGQHNDGLFLYGVELKLSFEAVSKAFAFVSAF